MPFSMDQRLSLAPGCTSTSANLSSVAYLEPPLDLRPATRIVPQLSAPHQLREGLFRMPAKPAIKAHGLEGKRVGVFDVSKSKKN